MNGEKKESGENWLCDCNGCCFFNMYFFFIFSFLFFYNRCWCLNGTIFTTDKDCTDRPGIEKISISIFPLFLVPCSSNFDCMGVKGKPVCKQLLNGGSKTCQPDSVCPSSKMKPTKYGESAMSTQKLCKDEQFCDNTNKCQLDTEDSCGTNRDCAKLNIEKKFCLNSGQTKH